MKTVLALFLRWTLALVIWLVLSTSLQWFLLSPQAADAWPNALVTFLSWIIGPAMGGYLSGVFVAAWFPAANHGAVYRWFLVVPFAMVFLLFVVIAIREWQQPSTAHPIAWLVLMAVQAFSFYGGAWLGRPANT